MEFLGFLVIGLVIGILVLPFVALAKANRAKRAVADIARRLSSLENELRNLRPQTVSAVQPEAPMTAPERTVKAVQPPIPAMRRSHCRIQRNGRAAANPTGAPQTERAKNRETS